MPDPAAPAVPDLPSQQVSRRLDVLAHREVADHVEVFSAVHDELAEQLAAAEG